MQLQLTQHTHISGARRIRLHVNYYYYHVYNIMCALRRPEQNREVYTSGIIIYTPIYYML